MICFTPRIMLETKVKYICGSFLIDEKQIGSEFQNKKVFIVTLAVLVYSFNNQTSTLSWNSSITTDNALLQCFCLSFLVSFDCFCKRGYDGDGHNCTGKIIYMGLVYVSTFKNYD